MPILKILTCVLLTLVGLTSYAGDGTKGKALSSTCSSCHGAYGLSSSEDYPNLAGQKPAYLISALQQYQTGLRKNTLMQAMVGPLSAKDIEDLATFFAQNAVIPSYSSTTRQLQLPIVNVSSEYYQVVLRQLSDTGFEVQMLNKLNAQ